MKIFEKIADKLHNPENDFDWAFGFDITPKDRIQNARAAVYPFILGVFASWFFPLDNFAIFIRLFLLTALWINYKIYWSVVEREFINSL